MDQPTVGEIRQLLHDLAELAKTPHHLRDQDVVDELLARKRRIVAALEQERGGSGVVVERFGGPRWIDTGSGPGWSPDPASR